MSNNLGYNMSFLGVNLSLPKVNADYCVEVQDGSGVEIKYIHFSLFQHKLRRLPLMAATNICGEDYSAAPRAGDEPWKYCDQIPDKHQIDNGFYGNDLNTFDRGHIVRRVDPCWGPDSVEAEQNTFNWANCTPQHKKINQKGGLWFQLEQHVMENGVKNRVADICVFAGPILDSADMNFVKSYNHTNVQIPSVFWKVIVWKKSDGKLYAVGFMMSQWEFIKDKLVNGPVVAEAMKTIRKPLPDDYFENLKFSDHQTCQVPVSAIEKATGIKFSWRNVSFPYKSPEFTALEASPLRNIHAYKDLFEVKSGATTAGAQLILNEIPTLSKTRVKALINEQETYLVKRYNIKNITL